MATIVKKYYDLLRYPVPAGPPPPTEYYARDVIVGGAGDLATRVADFDVDPAE